MNITSAKKFNTGIVEFVISDRDEPRGRVLLDCHGKSVKVEAIGEVGKKVFRGFDLSDITTGIRVTSDPDITGSNFAYVRFNHHYQLEIHLYKETRVLSVQLYNDEEDATLLARAEITYFESRDA